MLRIQQISKIPYLKSEFLKCVAYNFKKFYLLNDNFLYTLYNDEIRHVEFKDLEVQPFVRKLRGLMSTSLLEPVYLHLGKDFLGITYREANVSFFMNVNGKPQPIKLPDDEIFGGWVSDDKFYTFSQWDKNLIISIQSTSDDETKPVVYNTKIDFYTGFFHPWSKYLIFMSRRGDKSVLQTFNISANGISEKKFSFKFQNIHFTEFNDELYFVVLNRKSYYIYNYSGERIASLYSKIFKFAIKSHLVFKNTDNNRYCLFDIETKILKNIQPHKFFDNLSAIGNCENSSTLAVCTEKNNMTLLYTIDIDKPPV